MIKMFLMALCAVFVTAACCTGAPIIAAVQGDWAINAANAELTQATAEWAIATSDVLQGDLKIQADLIWKPAGDTARVGLVFSFKDSKNYAVCSLTKEQYKAWNATKPETIYLVAIQQIVDGKETLTNYCPWTNPTEGKHHLKLTVQGKQVLAHVDGKTVLQGGIIDSLIGGKPGLAALNSATQFSNVKISSVPKGTQLYGIGNLHRDSAGNILARWPYKEMVTRPCEFVFWCAANAGGNLIADEKGKIWPGYVYACTIMLNGTIGNPSMYPPQEISFFNNGFLDYYQFTGDKRGLDRAKELAAWLMAPEHMVPATMECANLSITKTVLGNVLGDADGKPMYLVGKIVEDMGECLISLEEQGAVAVTVLRLYHLTADKAYLAYCTGVADALLRLQLPEGNWNYRVNVRTGKPNDDWTANVIDNILFLDEMAATTGKQAYRASVTKAEKWLVDVPCKSNRWLGIFGDVPSNTDIGWAQKDKKGQDNLSGFVTMGAGRYLLSLRDKNPNYVNTAAGLRNWILDNFSGTDSNRLHGIAEQTVCFHVMPYHGFHQSMLEADLYEATGDEQYKKMAFHFLNAGMYQTEQNGFIHLLGGGTVQNGLDTWWCNILWAPTAYVHAMATWPETAPQDENHLLRVSSPLTMIKYSSDGVSYATARESTDRLVVKLRPKTITCNGKKLPEVTKLGKSFGWSYEEQRHFLQIKHAGGKVEVKVGKG